MTKHGMSRTLFYAVWFNMVSRCANPNNKSYKHYGGRGIAVAPEWREFQQFYDDMHSSYLAHKKAHDGDTSLERIDNEIGYRRDNCTWATRSEQQRNRRSWAHIVPHDDDQALRQLEVILADEQITHA